MEDRTQSYTCSYSTYNPPSTNNNSITFEKEYFDNNLFDDESIKSNSLANNINLQEEDKEKQQHNLNNNDNNLNFANQKYTKYSKLDKNFSLTCENCKSYFFITFHNYNYLTAKCKCKLVKNISPYKFISEYCSLNDSCFNQNNNTKKFLKYCLECERNLNEDNLKEKAEPYNENNNISVHETHHLIDLFNIKKEVEIITEKLNNINDDSQINKFCVKKILSKLIQYYKNCLNYYFYKYIKTEKFLIKEIFQIPRDSRIYVVLINIFSFDGLKNINSIYSIQKLVIDGKKTGEVYENLDILKNKVFSGLEKLELKNIKNLKDIKALTTCSFPNLKILCLSDGETNDDCVKVLEGLISKLPKIKFISLFKNKITSPEIFEVIKKFPTLEKFYIGGNEFDLNKLPNENKKYDFLPNLIELGISLNFTKKTNYFITKNLILENLKLLDVSENGLTSLKDFEKIHFKQLEEFWVAGDKVKGCLEKIDEINYLNNKETIKKIVLKQNKIKNIENLVNIIPSFPKIQLIDLRGNEIPRNEIFAVLSKIEEKGFESLVIIHDYYKFK